MPTIRTFSEPSTRRIKQAVDRVLGVDNRRGGPTRGGYMIGEVISGLITARSGSGSSVVYTAQGEVQTDIVTEALKAPLDRVFDPGVVDIVPAAVGTRCSIVRILSAQGEPVYRVGRPYGERWLTDACDSGGGAGTANSGVTGPAIERSRDARQLTFLPWTSQVQAITSGATGKFGFKLYTFPAGYTMIHEIIMSLQAAVTSITNVMRFAIGTTLSTGTGTTLSAGEANIWPQTQFCDFSGGASQSYVGDLTDGGGTVPVGINGTSAPVVAYLNFCPTANWTASENMTFSQRSTAEKAFSLMWRNGGLV